MPVTSITVTVTAPDGTAGIADAIAYALGNPLNYPDAAGIMDWSIDVSTDTGGHPDMTLVLYRLDQAGRRLISKHPKAAKDPELAAMLRGLRDEATALNGDSTT